MDRAIMKEEAKTALKAQFGTALLAMLIVDVLVSALNLIPVVGSAAMLIVAGPLNVGLAGIYIWIVNRRTAEMGQLFEPFSTNFTGSFVAYLLQVIFVLLWSLLLLVPGIMKAYSYSMTFYVMNREKIGGMDALKRSEELMNGHRKELFVLQLSFLPWMLLIPLTLGLVSIWLIPYITATQTIFFEKIYNGTAVQGTVE